ncbi:MAG: hypothetical protein R2911_12150 [Caldilineaceae bacterium]
MWRDGFFWLALAFSIFAVAPFLQPGYFWGANDARHHIYFLYEFNRVWQDGIWWPRWSPDFTFGYGYPFFNIYGPFSHFVAEFLLYYGKFSYTGAIKTVFGLSILGSAAAMYAYVRTWAGRQAALCAALVYVYAPYHLLNLYVRANLAESMAFVWLPLALWAVRQCVLQPSFGAIAGLAVSVAGLLLTSQLVTLLFLPLLGVYFLVLLVQYGAPDGTQDLMLPVWVRFGVWVRRALAPALGMAAAVGLSCIFWLPMVLEYGDVRVDQWYDGRYDFRGNFVYFFQLFSPQWGFGISTRGPDDTIGFQLGVVPLILAAVAIMLLWPRRPKVRWELACFGLAGVITAGLALQMAAPLWDVPLISTILRSAQFPWRWFTIATLCLSILAGMIAHPLLMLNQARDRLTPPLLALAAIIVLGSYPLLRIEVSEPVEGPIGLPSLMRFQRSSDEMTGSTRWVDEVPMWGPIAQHYIDAERANPDSPVEPIRSMVDYDEDLMDYTPGTGFVVDSVAHNSVMEEVWYFAGQADRRIIFNQFYYPGWTAYLLDGEHGALIQKLPIIPEETGTLGRMTVPVPKGEGYVLLRFEDTPPRTVGKIVSALTMFLLLLAGLWVHVFRKPAKNV